MRASHDLSRVSTSFDEHNIVPNAGLLPAAVLAQRIDLAGLIDRRLHLAKHGANGGAKALSVIGSMLAGGDSIDDVAVLRTGAAASLFDATRAPSTGAASFLTETISRVRGAGGTGQLTVRADSAFYSRTVIATAAKLDVRFSITARQDKRVRAAIAAIDEAAWAPIPYWLSTPEVSGADIAETTFTVFAGDKRHARQVRLVVRRVAPTPGSQLALFTTWDYPLHHRPGPAPGPGRGRPPPPRRRRADHRRAQERRPGAPALGQVHRQRRLAGPGSHGPQPRPSRRAPRRTRTGHGNGSKPAPQDLHHAGPTRPQRPKTTPATTRLLALGRPPPTSPDPHRRNPDALLITTHRPDDQDLGEAGRPATQTCP